MTMAKTGLRSVGMAAGALVALLTMTACSETTPPEIDVVAEGLTQSATGYPLKVYFSKFNDSLDNPDAVFPFNRVSPTLGIATFAMQLIIAGPTLEERGAGYFSE